MAIQLLTFEDDESPDVYEDEVYDPVRCDCEWCGSAVPLAG